MSPSAPGVVLATKLYSDKSLKNDSWIRNRHACETSKGFRKRIVDETQIQLRSLQAFSIPVIRLVDDSDDPTLKVSTTR